MARGQSLAGAVVNCFQISIFAVHEQLNKDGLPQITVVNCFQISIFAVHEQRSGKISEHMFVVNCFQISIFAVHEQPHETNIGSLPRCELLSN